MLDRLFDLISAIWKWLVPFIVLNPYQSGVVLRLGTLHRTLTPGFHWVWPLGIEEVIYDSVVTDTAVLPPQGLTTKDGVQTAIQILLTYHVVDIVKLLLTVEDKEKALHDSAWGVVAGAVGQHTWVEIHTKDFAETLYKAIRRRGFRYGIEVDECQLVGLQKTRTFILLQNNRFE